MADEDEGIIWNRLFVAVPELTRDITLLERLRNLRIISQNEHDDLVALGRAFNRTNRVVRSVQGRTLLERIILVAPELYSVSTINLLRRFGFISEAQGHRARIVSRAIGALTTRPTGGGADTVVMRLARVIGTVVSNEAIDLAVLQGRMTPEQANKLRAGILAGRRGRNIIVDKHATRLFQVLQLMGHELFNADMVRAALLAGIISPRNAQIFGTMLELGPTVWRTARGLYEAEGYAQRLLIASGGVLDNRMIDVLLDYNAITEVQATLLRPAVGAARELVRSQLIPPGKGRRYRPVAGENPVKTFARVSRATDKQILVLLAQAARENGEYAEALMREQGVGARTRAGQARINQSKLYGGMRAMYEDIGYLIIRGEREAAQAAFEAMNEIESKVWRKAGKPVDGVREVLEAQGRSGIEAFISRQENVVALSRLVYKNRDLALGQIDKRINIALLRGQSAKEFARDVERLIRPDVPGGVSYAAMRLARTEINNAFHRESIRHTREMPWVTGYKWHLSNSHPGEHRDICDVYAAKPSFKKTEVPNKPHPHCLCYITPITVEPEEFSASLRKGRYNRYIKSQEPVTPPRKNSSLGVFTKQAAVVGGSLVARRVIHGLADRVIS